MKTKSIIIALIIVFPCLVVALKMPVVLGAEEPPPPIPSPTPVPLPSGIAEGTGTHFEITNSEYLNVSLQSSEEITIRLESVPKTISLQIEASSVFTSTTLTLSGLEPGKTYYKYQDSYKNETQFTTSETGTYVFDQDLTKNHFIWFQEIRGTIFLPDNCSNYGAWDLATSTCTLTQDLTESIEIEESDFILDCNNHKITTPEIGVGFGIYQGGKSNVTIKNCQISNFSHNILLIYSNDNILSHNIISDSPYLGIALVNADKNILNKNTVLRNTEIGIYLRTSTENILEENMAQDNYSGFVLRVNSHRNTLRKNIADHNNLYFGIFIDESDENTLEDNTTNFNARDGILLCNSNQNTISNNQAISNQSAGINLHLADNNQLSQNLASNNYQEGFRLTFSNDNTFLNNTAASSTISPGIFLYYSNNNTFSENTIKQNRYQGIHLRYSNNNKIYHNNFIDNGSKPQAFVFEGVGNLFQEEYPIGGNYWSDYAGLDLKRGPNQDEPGSDGIGDTPYNFTGGQDRYPFMKEDGWEVPKEIKVIQLGALDDIDIRDIEDPIWTIESPSIFDPIADAMKDRFIITYPGSFKIKSTIKAFPVKPSWQPTCDYAWIIQGTDKRGSSILKLKDTDDGWTADFEVHPPQKVGRYILILAFTIYDDKGNKLNFQRMNHPLYVTYEKPKLPKSEEKPKEIWLEKATDWASGATNEEEIALKITEGINKESGWLYGYPPYRCTNLQYYDAYSTPEKWSTLIEGITSCADCVGFSNTWQWLVEILGVDVSTLQRYGKEGLGFVTKTNSIAPDSQKGNAHPLSGAVDRWSFPMHQLGKLGIRPWDKFYDPTFGKKYDSKDEFIEWDQITKWYLVDSKQKADLTEGHKIYLIDKNANYGWGDYEYHSGAKFTGNYTTYGSDPDGDGIYNALFMDVEVDVTVPGEYIVSGELKFNDTFISARSSRFPARGFWFFLPALELGVKTVTVDFSGEDIYNAGIDGVYTANLFIEDEASKLIIDEKSFDTPNYNHTQFGEYAYKLAKFQKVIRRLEDIPRTGQLIITGITFLILITVLTLIGYKYWKRKTKITLLAFIFILIIFLFAILFLVIGFLTSGTFASQQIDSVDSTKNFPSSINSGAKFTGNYTTYGSDPDGDGIYNYLAINAEVDVTTLGDYGIGGVLKSNGKVVTIEDAIKDVEISYNLGWITKEFVKKILITKLKVAQELEQQKEKQLEHFDELIKKAENPVVKQKLEKAREEYEKKMNEAITKILELFIKEVKFYNKKGYIAEQALELLIKDAQYIIEHL